MASKSRKSKKSKSSSAFYGLVFGLVLGVAAAATVAIFVTQVPMPFNDKASRGPAMLPSVGDAPDPNTGLYGKDGPAGTIANGPTVTGTSPMPPGTGTAINGQSSDKAKGGKPDDLGTLIASLGSEPNQSKAASGSSTPAAKPAANGKSSSAAATQNTYYLQAGAFHSQKDADAVKARIIMMGLPVKVQTAKVSGDTINRVRVGPFKGIDAMNTARAKLGAEKIETSVVRK
jgi:cell division protein FtsN